MRTRYHRNVWSVFFAAGLLGLGLFALRLRPAVESTLFVAYSAATITAVFIGLYIHRPRPLPAWLLIAIGLAFNFLGDLAYTLNLFTPEPAIPASSFDWFYIVGQVCLIAGLVFIFFWFRQYINGNAAVQGAMVAIGLATLVWVQIISPNLGKALGWAEWARLLLYPFGLLTIFSIASIYLMSGLGKNWSYRLMYIAIMFYAIGLSFYLQASTNASAILNISGEHLAYSMDAAYAAAYLLAGAAYLHPAMRDLHTGISEQGKTVSRIELILLTAAFWIGPLVYTLSNPYSIKMDVLIIMASMLIIFTLNEWRLARLVRILEDQNEELNKHREMLHHQAFHDALTGLPNRASLYNHLEALIEDTRLNNARGAVFLIDVNNFKQVNDTLGHDEGDRVLKDVSNAFTSLKRKEDVVGRWGGDEFMMVLRNLPDETSAKALARRLHQDIRWTVSGSEGSVAMSISIGICLIPTGTEKLQTIVKKADLALYQAKRMPETGISLSGW